MWRRCGARRSLTITAYAFCILALINDYRELQTHQNDSQILQPLQPLNCFLVLCNVGMYTAGETALLCYDSKGVLVEGHKTITMNNEL